MLSGMNFLDSLGNHVWEWFILIFLPVVQEMMFVDVLSYFG